MHHIEVLLSRQGFIRVPDIKQTIAILSFAALLLWGPAAYALDTNVGAAVKMRQVISATKGQDLNFGQVDYEPSHSGAIQLGTDGNIQLGSGTFGISLNGGTPTAGDITLSGDGQSTIEISCENNGVLTAGGANTLNLQNVEFAVDAGQAFGSGTQCAGLAAPAAAIDLASNNTPKILIGGALNVASNAITSSNTYSTTNAGGDPVTMRVVYQ